MKETYKKYGMIFLCMNLIGLGIALFLENKLGSDPIALLCDGLQQVIPLSFGTISMLYNLVIIGIAAIVAKNNLGAGTIAYGLFAGYFIEFYAYVLSPLQLYDQGFLVRLVGYGLGQVFFVTALAMLIQLKLGMNALDAILLKVESKTHIPYFKLRTGVDFLYVGIGVVLGGTFGVGTVICVLTTGILVTKITQRIPKARVMA